MATDDKEMATGEICNRDARRIFNGELATGAPHSPVVRTYKPTSRDAKLRAERTAAGRARDAYEDRSIPVSSAADAEMRRAWLADQCISVRQREEARAHRRQGLGVAVGAALKALDLGLDSPLVAAHADQRRRDAVQAAIARTYNGRDPRLAGIESRPVHPQTRIDREKEVSKNTR